jgi:succinate-semialdehyde dehydrogenase/glutarate-semialdehyde dehydrogenase
MIDSDGRRDIVRAVATKACTDSTEVGGLRMRQCSDHGAKISLELGGNAPFIVFDGAELDIAVGTFPEATRR